MDKISTIVRQVSDVDQDSVLPGSEKAATGSGAFSLF